MQSDDGRVDTEVIRRNMQLCITFKIYIYIYIYIKWGKALETAQNHVGLPCKRRITPVKTHFDYLIQSLHSILENKGSINCLYGSMDNIPDIIRERNPSLADWSVTSTVVMTMQRIVGSIVKN